MSRAEVIHIQFDSDLPKLIHNVDNHLRIFHDHAFRNLDFDLTAIHARSAENCADFLDE